MNNSATLQAETAEAREVQLLATTWRRKSGFIGWLSSTNHKDIGMRFIVTAFIFFALSGVLALLVRLQLMRPENNFLGPDFYNQFFTTHGTAMIFLFAVPIMEGFGIYFVPMMIGTRNVCFPRLAAFSYFTYLFGGILLFTGLFLNIGPDVGWFSYVPLAGPEYGIGKRVDIWSQMVTLVEIASMAGSVDIVVTVFKCRAPGMSLSRIPLFVWAQLITSIMVLFAMPAVTLCSTMLSMDRLTHLSTHFYNPAEGGDAILWQHLFWFFGHPDVYIIFIPATGFISAIIPTFSRRPVFGYTPLVLSMIATAFIGFGVWVHHMFATPLPKLGQSLFTASSLMIVIPNGIQIFCWIATLWGGKPKIRTPLLFALGFFAVFVFGGLSGVILASTSIDLQVHDTYFVVAHFHYVLIGGAVFPLFAACYYWFPKWTGRMLSETLGIWHCALFFIGFNLTFFPMHQLGLKGMTRRIYTYLPETGWGSLNFLATVGAFLMGVGVLVFFLNILRSRKYGRAANENPWGGGTLEWATTSPPPDYNFPFLPTVQGREPIWQNPPDSPILIGLTGHKRQLICTSILDGALDHRYNIAGDSIWPLCLAVANAVAWIVGGIFHPVGFLVGLILAGLSLFGWFWQSTRSSKESSAAPPGERKIA